MKPRALIVDDSITVRMDLKESLEEAGIVVDLSATAASARDALSRHAYDVLILDVMLPDADGLELLRELKSDPASAGIPVMLLSSEGEVRDRVRGLAVGADEYLGKPYNRVQVVSRTRALCRKGRSQGREKRLVLVVDDSPSFRGRISEALEEGGYEVAEASNGEDGLRLAAELRPDALLVDQQMPGLDGVGVLRMLRADAALRRLPCLLLTASQEPDAELRALESGADAYLPKSGETDLVLAKLSALLRSGADPRGPGNGNDLGTSLLEAKRVLAVDDSPSYLAELSDRLREDAYDVIAAASGEDALDLLAAQSVDAILLDRMMPGLSGEETCRRIKANPAWRDIPLLLLTASQDRQDVLDGIHAGADDYIIKSDDFNVLKARLKAQLRRRQFEDENRVFRERILRQEMEALEMRAVKELAESRAAHIAALEESNRELFRAREEALALAKELESFSYSVSHDLRAPLRSIDGFSLALMEDDADRLDEAGLGHLRRIRAATQRMGQLIDDMLGLAKVSRKEMAPEDLDLSDMVRRIGEELAAREPERRVRLDVQPDLRLKGDAGLVRILLENLVNNAWKFTKERAEAHIEFFAETPDGRPPAYTLRDDGAGFDMAYAHKLFGVFQRLHSATEFPGTGVGLATVLRIVGRHHGRIWAEGNPGKGAAFHFTW